MLTITLETEYQKNIAEQLCDENLAALDNNQLFIDEEHIYQIEPEQLSALNVPDFFDGYISVKLLSTPNNPNCKFRLEFADRNGKVISFPKVNGEMIQTSPKTQAILPKIMYELVQLCEKSNSQYDEALCWQIIELAINNPEAKLRFNGLASNTHISNIENIGIDIRENSDGSILVEPRLPYLEEQTHKRYKDSLYQGSSLSVISEVKNSEQTLHIMHEPVMNAYQRVKNVGRIEKENISKFLQNPAPFILNDEEEENSLPISFNSYRILGMGKPYIGYFGSVKIDSPIAKALAEDGDPAIKQAIKEHIEQICEDKSLVEVKAIQQKVESAIDDSAEYCDIDGENVFFPAEYALANKCLTDVVKKLEEHSGSSKKDKALVIKIAPNDEVEISFKSKYLKPLSEIRIDNLEQGSLFDELIYPPKSHQIAGVNWLVDLYESNYLGGILADDMGLGKTYQVITFLNHLFNQPKFENKRVLIVAPIILLDNWKSEIEKFLNKSALEKFNVKVIRGSNVRNFKTTEKIGEGEFNRFDVPHFLQLDLNVVIISYDMLSNFQFSFADSAFNWGCIIFDEAHKIKNPNSLISQASKAVSSNVDFTVLLTGTPIENELRDLWALFDVFDPAYLGSWKKFRKEFVQNERDTVDEELRQKVSNYLLRRLKKDYLKELPARTVKTHCVEFTSEETALYHQYRNEKATALSRLHKLKAFSLHKDLSYLSHKEIRLEEFSKSQKLLTLLENIKADNEKAIIFVMRRSAQDILRFGIRQKFGIDPAVINGANANSDKMKKLLLEFREAKGFGVIILSTLAAGVGLTITEANHVIHYKRWWNPSKEDQASDRVYRIGQKKEVYIHHIIGKLPNNDSSVISIDQAVDELIQIKRETAGFLVPAKPISEAAVMSRTMSNTLEEQISGLDGLLFERLIKKLYEAQGFSCDLTASDGMDHGADVIAVKDKECQVIQCKHSGKGHSQDQQAMYQLINEAKDYFEADKLIVVTNTKFNSVAHKLAQQHNIQVIEGKELCELIKQYQISVIE